MSEITISEIIKKNIYFYTCITCKNRRATTLKEDKAKNGICRKCRNNQPDPRQISIFDTKGAVQ